MEFKQIIGQQNAVEYLHNSIRNDRIAHALIFEGEDGMGKMTLSNIYAQALLCTSQNKPCNTCSGCSKFTSQNHPDFRLIAPCQKKSITTDEISELLSDAYIIPNDGGHKVYIIQKAHMMTPTAQNKLLKILEEPPEYLVIILLCDNISSVLQTILSRSITLKMQRLNQVEMHKALRSLGVDEDKINDVVPIAYGNVGYALKIANSKNTTNQFEEYKKIFFMIDQQNKIEVFSFLEKNKKSIHEILLSWQMILSNCIKIKSDTKNSGYIEDEINYSNKYEIDDIINKLTYILETESRLAANAQYLPTVDWLLSNL
ncbi:MAG: DNA polymerase III subunit [Clostridiales bacterium]|nr:DNA polymerase III subunit [Clostridiales bacterium]